MQPSTREILFGCDEPPEPEIALQAGPLTMLLRGTQLLYLRIGDAEVWHGVSFLFRDVDWGTPLPVVEHVEHESKVGGFSVRLVASRAMMRRRFRHFSSSKPCRMRKRWRQYQVFRAACAACVSQALRNRMS